MTPITQSPILLTGLTGYLGSRIAIQLLEAGYSVRGSVRNAAKAETVVAAIGREASTHRLELVTADLLDADSWTAAAAGCDYVLHVASPFFASLPDHPDDLIVPARQGTLNVLRAATAAGVKRVVLTSSLAAVAYGLDRTPDAPLTLDETRWTNTDHPDTTPYVLSKTYAERAAWDYVRATPGAPVLATINPGAVLGPLLGNNPSDSLLLVSKLLRGEFPGVPKFGFMVVDVRDVADLHLRAMTDPAAAGQRYLATSEFVTMQGVVDVLRAAYPAYARKLPRFTLPDWVLRLGARFDDDTKGVLNELGLQRIATAAKARRELGWTSRPAAESIRATADDLIRLGLV